ncbi:TPA: autotransporter outer membrane beta-barrel domain-containing protein, partial [Neisseria meningitidis]
MKLEASKQKFKKSFIISLFFSILYTSPLLAVDYVYDNSKLTNEQIDRLKKLRDKSSEYWKQETYLLKPTNGSSQNSLKVPALYSKTHQFKNINNSKKISFYDKEYTEDYLVGFARGFGVEKRNGEEEKPLRQYFKD